MFAASLGEPPRTADVIDAKRISSTSLTTAPTKVAAIRPPNSDGTNEIVAWAATPVSAPPMKRVEVYVAHFSRGARSESRGATSSGSPSIEAAPTTAAASGPKRTAAMRVGMTEIDCSVVRVNRTLDRSATAATSASAMTVAGDSSS